VVSSTSVTDDLDRYLESAQSAMHGGLAHSSPPAHPSGFGELYLPEPGRIPETLLLEVAGLPADFIDGLLARRGSPRFLERVCEFALQHRSRHPRLIRQIGWALLREDPHQARPLAAMLLARGDLRGEGEIAFLCDLAEEDPKILVPYLPRLLERLAAGDLVDPGEGEHRLSDLLCLTDIPPSFLAAQVAPRWESLPDERVRRILLRWLVHHRAVPLVTYRGTLEERLHHPKTRYQAYSYHLLLGREDHRLLDLSQELQLNLSSLPKYAPSNHLRRFVGKRIEAHGYVERTEQGPPTFLLQSLQEQEPAPQREGGRERPRGRR
jgi:hypothetical protein